LAGGIFGDACAVQASNESKDPNTSNVPAKPVTNRFSMQSTVIENPP
jgi:hypothetical protein